MNEIYGRYALVFFRPEPDFANRTTGKWVGYTESAGDSLSLFDDEDLQSTMGEIRVIVDSGEPQFRWPMVVQAESYDVATNKFSGVTFSNS